MSHRQTHRLPSPERRQLACRDSLRLTARERTCRLPPLPTPHVHDALEGAPARRPPPANRHAPPTLPSCPSNPLQPPPTPSWGILPPNPLLGHPDLAPNQPLGHATPRHSVTTTHGMPQRSSLHIPTDIAWVVRCGKKARLARIALKRRPYIWWWNVHR